MSGFAVDLEFVADLVDRMQVCATQFQAVEDDVSAQVRRLHVQRRGVAAAEQQEAHAQWRAGARQMREALTVLRTIGATAVTTGQTYVRKVVSR